MNSKLKLFSRGFGLAGVVMLLGACASSPYNGYQSAPPEAKEIVKDGGYSPEAMAQIAIVQNPDFPKGPNQGKISPKALKKIQEYAISCQEQIDAQLAGAGQSAIGGAIPYGIAGTGTGLAASAAWGKSVSASKYATYGGIAYLLPGAVNGLITGSYAMASAKGSCTREFWEDVVKTDPVFKGTHVVVVYAGKTAGNSIPPALDKSPTVPAAPVLAEPHGDAKAAKAAEEARAKAIAEVNAANAAKAAEDARVAKAVEAALAAQAAKVAEEAKAAKAKKAKATKKAEPERGAFVPPG